MWPYDDGRSRGMPPDARLPRSSQYYDDDFDRPSRYQPRAPEPPLETGRPRRKSILVDPEDSSHSRSRHSRPRDSARVVASDDGDPFYGGKTSRHDVEHKNSDRNRDFRKMRGGLDYDEAAAFKRPSKSYSPVRTARDPHGGRGRSPPPAKAAWPDDDLDGGRHGHKSSKKKSKAHGYDDDFGTRGGYAEQPPRGRFPYDDPPSRYPDVDKPSRRPSHRERGGFDDGYGRGRPPPSYYDDPYDESPRHRDQRNRRSMPPRARYDDPYGEPHDDYRDRPRRHASVGPHDRYGNEPRSRGVEHGKPKKNANQHAKSKKAAKEAGNLFMTHAMPVIKKEAVPFLMKSAKAYMDSRK